MCHEIFVFILNLYDFSLQRRVQQEHLNHPNQSHDDPMPVCDNRVHREFLCQELCSLRPEPIEYLKR